MELVNHVRPSLQEGQQQFSHRLYNQQQLQAGHVLQVQPVEQTIPVDVQLVAITVITTGPTAVKLPINVQRDKYVPRIQTVPVASVKIVSVRLQRQPQEEIILPRRQVQETEIIVLRTLSVVLQVSV